MRKWFIVIVAALFLIVAYTNFDLFSSEEYVQPVAKATLPTEAFIQQYLLKDNGLIRTNITEQKNVYLSESVGLWMEYLNAKNDFLQFDQQVEVLRTYFLTKDSLVTWKVHGTKKARANAFIDDLRIIDALYTAGEQWNHSSYTKLAKKMSKQLVRYQVREGLMVDYVDLTNKLQGSDITLSYIIPSGFDQMKQAGILPDEVYSKNKKVLLNAPHSAVGFYPKSFHVPARMYSYEDEVNLIDQFYVGYHRAQWNGDVTPLLTFAKTAFTQNDGKLYGKYDGKTGKPVVSYEAPAVYALAILMCLELEEDVFAKNLYVQMKNLPQDHTDSPYNGGYIDSQSKETHSFDNLLALLAERRGLDENIFR